MIYTVIDPTPTVYSDVGSFLGFVSLCPSQIEDHVVVYESLVKNYLIRDTCDTKQIFLQVQNWKTHISGEYYIHCYNLFFSWMERGKKRHVKIATLYPFDDERKFPFATVPSSKKLKPFKIDEIRLPANHWIRIGQPEYQELAQALQPQAFPAVPAIPGGIFMTPPLRPLAEVEEHHPEDDEDNDIL